MTPEEINKKAKNMKPGDRFYYTGDMANAASFGTVVASGSNEFYSYYDTEIDPIDANGEKVARRVYVSSFTAGPGQRYKSIEQYDAEREEKLAAFKKQYGLK
jgi:hypothetical protein